MLNSKGEEKSIEKAELSVNKLVYLCFPTFSVTVRYLCELFTYNGANFKIPLCILAGRA
jgi:hypothetical protein